MASKRLARLEGFESSVVERLARNKIFTCQDVLYRLPIELMELGNLGEPHVSKAIQLVCEAVAPKPTRVSAIKAGRFMTTLLPGLDVVLQGGIPQGTITELVGPSGCGKTQFCLQTCVAGVLEGLTNENGGGTVLYIDTEGAFRPDRCVFDDKLTLAMMCPSVALTKIARTRYPDRFQDEDAVNRLQGLEEVIISQNVGLVLVDSVASAARKDFDGRASGQARNDLLMLEATLLKYIAEEFSIPVIVTNHITTRFTATGDGFEGGTTTAALGNTWSHSVNTRMVMEYAPGNMRRVRIAKSPIAPLCSVLCRIEAAGLVQCGEVSLSGQGDQAALSMAAKTSLQDYQGAFGSGNYPAPQL